MLATNAQQPPRGAHFDFEIKFDGFRCGLFIEDGAMRLVSRQGTNFTSWFPELAGIVVDVACTNALLDGEIIVGSGSVESFNILLRRARLRGRSIKDALPVSLVAFDVLAHDGVDWRPRPLSERREHLRTIVTESERIAISRVFPDGPALLSIAAAHGLEGIVAKHRRSVYEPGARSLKWLKTKVRGASEGHDWNGTEPPATL